jgi:hypothetical protein
MMCNRTSIQAWEKFTRVTISGRLGGGNAIAETQPEEPQADITLAEDLCVYPNPSTGSVTIRVPQPSQVRMMTVTGASVFSQEVEESVSVDNLSPGLYVVRVSNGERTRWSRLVVR